VGETGCGRLNNTLREDEGWGCSFWVTKKLKEKTLSGKERSFLARNQDRFTGGKRNPKKEKGKGEKVCKEGRYRKSLNVAETHTWKGGVRCSKKKCWAVMEKNQWLLLAEIEINKEERGGAIWDQWVIGSNYSNPRGITKGLFGGNPC